MALLDTVRSFAQLHVRARAGQLSAEELPGYRGARDALAREILATQQLSLEPGQKARRTVRVACGVELELSMQGRTVRARTLNVSAGGFAALLVAPPALGEEVSATLFLKDGAPPLSVQAKAVNVKHGMGSSRVGFEFQGRDEATLERMETLVFDTIIQLLR